jgi:hypothetical protein
MACATASSHRNLCAIGSCISTPHSHSPGTTDVIVYPEGWHLLTRQLRTREPLQDMAQWLQNTALPHRQSTAEAQQVVCKGL